MAQKKPANIEAPEQFTIFVETLAGSTFEVKVSPQDIVRSVKSKIQRVEGIPVSHQHLLYNLKELNDSSCITEPSIALHDGATIKLVLSMRGGPISLVHQTVPFNRTVLRNLLQINREELQQDLPAGCKMAIVVLRVGDQLNLLHVVEDTDPPADSLDDEMPICLEENSRTMEKVCDLKDKMEKLSLQRKKPNFKREELSSNPSHVDVVNSKKLDNKIKLPSIKNNARSSNFKSRSDFSKIPILPDIVPKAVKSPSRDLEFAQLDEETSAELEEGLRPKTCPATLSDSHFYDVCHRAGYTTKSLQAIPTHYRSCVSASYHDWHNQKDVIPSLDILPHVSNLLSSRATFETIHHRKPVTELHRTVNKVNPNVREESEYSEFLNNNELGLTENTSSGSSKYSGSRTSRELWSTNSHYSSLNNFRPEVSAKSSSEFRSQFSTNNLPLSEILRNKPQDNLVQLVNKKISDKNTRPRCSECKKKLSLTTTFECRCGFAFCSFHRYSETHNCSYDFKKDSRKILKQANPSVIAPKLPKI